MMLNQLWRAARACPTAASRRLGRRRAAAEAARAARHRAPDASSGWSRAAGLALRARRRTSSRSASASRTCRTPCTSPTGCSTGRGRCGSRCGPASTSAATTRRSSAERGRATRCASVDDRFEVAVRARALPPLRLRIAGERSTLRLRRPSSNARSSTASRQSRGYDARGELWSPGYFDVRARRASSRSR